MLNVFISYAHRDLKQVKEIARFLQRAAIDTWMDQKSLKGGDVWTTEIAEGISKCNLFLLMMSGASMKSDSVRREVQLAFDRKKKIIILRLERVRIPRWMQFQLAGIQWISIDERQWRARLKDAIGADRQRGTNATSRAASGAIGVLLVDDNVLAREGWKRVLRQSKQINVLGDTSPRELVARAAEFPPPETIIAGYSFVKSRLMKSTALKRVWGGLPRVIILATNKEQVRSAFKAGADWSAPMPFDSHDLITWVRTLSDDAKRLCSEYRDMFTAIRSTAAQDEKYAELVSAALQLLFHPDLVDPEFARTPAAASRAKRLVFRNQGREHKFWSDTLAAHGSKYIVADIYNGPLKTAHIQRLAGYLSESHGLFGLVIGRRIPNRILHSACVELFENERKAILLLDDAQLTAMLEYKAGGVNPTFELELSYQQLIADAWK